MKIMFLESEITGGFEDAVFTTHEGQNASLYEVIDMGEAERLAMILFDSEPHNIMYEAFPDKEYILARNTGIDYAGLSVEGFDTGAVIDRFLEIQNLYMNSYNGVTTKVDLQKKGITKKEDNVLHVNFKGYK